MCGPVFRRVAESIMAKAHQSDFSTARDTTNSPLPYVMEGDLEASRQVLKQFGITHNADFGDYATETIWGDVKSDLNALSLSPSDEPKDSVPDVCGYGLRDAIFRLEQAGLSVKTKGAGVVVQQSKKPGSAIHHGDTIMLTLVPKSKK